ncbi:MAG: polysaccharide biosynthesis tyrosine autokinase [Bacteroidales bacterium]|jgi:capsular exopolysaccharide synthesis family protein|nr:polysaccharide biosynthesis tyrosine autokinase [Bacteroidales bacterium]
MTHKKFSKINDEFDLSLLIFILSKTWYVVIISVALFFSVAWIYLRYTPNLYEATTVIQIEPENKPDVIQEQTKLYSNYNQLATKIDFLKSSAFLESSLSKLPLEVNYFYKGTILNNELYRNSPFTVRVLSSSQQINGVLIDLTFDKSSDLVVSYEIGDTKYKKRFTNGSGGVNVVTEHFNILVSVNDGVQIKKGDTYAIQIFDKESICSMYSHKMQATILNEAAKTIQIKVQDYNPQKASEIVNTIAVDFAEYDKIQKQENANNIINFIDDQLEMLEDELFKTHNEMEEYKRENNIEVSELRSKTLIQQKIEDLNSELAKLDYEKTLLDKINTSVSGNKDIDVYSFLADIIGSNYQGALSAILTNLQSLLLQREQAAYSYTKESGHVKQLDYQIDIQKRVLAESILSFKNNIDVKAKQLRTELNALTQELLMQVDNTKALELKKFSRIMTINETYYNQLIETKTKYSIAKVGYVSQNIILEKSKTPAVPISPKRNQIYFLSVIVGFLLGIGYIAYRYLFYSNIDTVSDIRKYSNVALLGTIPMVKREMRYSQLLVDKEPKSILAEAMRGLRTNMQFISSGSDQGIISITSTIPSEGKTFVAVNIAGIIAYSGKKVIVLDLDMRKPKIHRAFSTEEKPYSNSLGVSNILSGMANYKDCVNVSSIDTLHFITAGTIPPNPSELILSDNFTKLVEELKQDYDFIVFDNPPIGLVTDAMHTFKMADYPIYVFKAGYSKRIFVQNLEYLWNELGLKNISFVLNSVNESKNKYGYGNRYGGYYYGSKYSYGVGYNYGYYEEKEEVEEGKFSKIKNRIIGKSK